MNDKIEIVGLFKDGWNLDVPASRTAAFLEYLRGKVVFSIDVGMSSGGGVPDTDCFVISSEEKESRVKKLISTFKG